MTSGMALKRIKIQQKELNCNKPENCITAGPIDDNILNWEAIISGPEDTPYFGGEFVISIVFPADYPFKPPKVKWLTKMFHPDFNSYGGICSHSISFLSENWHPMHTISTLIVSLVYCLKQPCIQAHNCGNSEAV